MRDQLRYEFTPVTERGFDLPDETTVAAWLATAGNVADHPVEPDH